jgi:uncharacterized membrane protein
MKHDLILFVGRFHPLLVHLPIGGLVLLAFLELVAAVSRWKDVAQTSRWILAFVLAGAVASAAAGWMLANDGGYEAHLLYWHRALGFALTGACLLTLLLRCWGRLWAYRASLVGSLALLVAVSDLGGSITHGRNFLTRYAPPLLRARAGLLVQNTQASADCLPMQQPMFDSVVEPILRQRCTACHGAERHKAQLRLDSFQWCLHSGQDGPVIKPGHAKDSPLIQRLLRPLEADGHMPPEDQPQLTSQEIALLESWVNAGAPTTVRVDLGIPPGEITSTPYGHLGTLAPCRVPTGRD